ncbi:GNAT family N-acetyltransferase [Roseibaca sp. Y0-43]|uniref:GNAT family N-acetyltransferase n=1 Tax=Roseibaca sp. Y0-43 TaxID=2816854 RepID=UPI001D0C63D0|nr:GNAT family N-acetyltransferase [Roseibaca sp. Y0-43]MCC1480314.1 GNAT family N-acetyltransferase [Roseibaca sp. Y0-43]
MQIRPLRASDRPEWNALWHAYLEFYDTTLSRSVYDATFASLLADREMCALVAEDDGRLIGLAHVIFHAHCWRPEGVSYLQDLYALPEARGKGVGRALIEAVYALADARGRPAVYWTTQDFNTTARQLYDRVGQLTPFIKYARPA